MAGGYPNYGTDHGARIRYLVQHRPEYLESALSEMGVNPFMAKWYGEKGGSVDPDEIIQFLDETKEARTQRLLDAGRKRARGERGLPSPWSDPHPMK